MLIVPLNPVPSQLTSVLLSNQACQVKVYQKSYGLYIDVYLNNTLIIAGVICQNKNRILRSVYLGFAGDFIFIDNQGDANPDYTGLGGRFSLAYLSPEDIALWRSQNEE